MSWECGRGDAGKYRSRRRGRDWEPGGGRQGGTWRGRGLTTHAVQPLEDLNREEGVGQGPRGGTGSKYRKRTPRPRVPHTTSVDTKVASGKLPINPTKVGNEIYKRVQLGE